MTDSKFTPPPAVWVTLSWDLGIAHSVTGRQPTGPRDPQLGPYRYLLAERVETALVALARIAHLTKAQWGALVRVANSYDNGAPLFSIEETTGLKELTSDIRHQLESLMLIERYDRVAEVMGARPRWVTFIYFRPTAAGRAVLQGVP
jgi:hypothetical protein